MSVSANTPTAWPKLPLPLRVLHWVIIVNFALNSLYAAYLVFFVLLPPSGASGPLFGAALAIPHELMMTRRAYGIEFWLSTGGLSLYLAITEILPRRLRLREP